jgi:ribosome modulation factor
MQSFYEAEGAASGLAGQKREDCPYSTDLIDAWNFWVYGCENAQHEMEIIKQGFVTFSSTAVDAVPFNVPIRQAIDNRMWKPKYVTVTRSEANE